MGKATGIIYCIQNKVNLKQYVGQTIGKLEYRFSRHINDAFKRNKSTAIATAIRKYGQENFIIFVLEICKISELNEKEEHWISFLNTYDKGYNRVRRSNHDRQELDKIIDEYKNGKTQKELSKEYNICTKTLSYQLKLQGIDTYMNSKSIIREFKKQKIIELYKNGKTIRKISNEIGSCRKTIKSILENEGFKILKGRTLTEIKKDMIIKTFLKNQDLYSINSGLKKTSIELSVNTETIKKVLKERNIKYLTQKERANIKSKIVIKEYNKLNSYSKVSKKLDIPIQTVAKIIQKSRATKPL